MTTSSSEPLAQKCCWFEAGVYCQNGLLFKYSSGDRPGDDPERDIIVHYDIMEAVTLEGMPLHCPKCEGKGMLLTNKGRELLAFLEVFGRPFLRDLVDEFHEERDQH
jgi:hypothetical protein